LIAASVIAVSPLRRLRSLVNSCSQLFRDDCASGGFDEIL
jgi:hypothetical protein